MEWARAKVYLADRYVEDVKVGAIAAPLVQNLTVANIFQNGYKQQSCVYIISQHQDQPPFKVGMDHSGLQRRLDNFRTILRKMYVYYAIGFPREGYNQSSYGLAAETFLHWRLRRFRQRFPAYDAERDEWTDFGGNPTELFDSYEDANGKRHTITLSDIDEAVRSMFDPNVVREWKFSLPANLAASYRIAPSWMYKLLRKRLTSVKGFATYHEQRLKAQAQQDTRKKSLKGKAVVYYHNNVKYNVDPDSIDTLQVEPKAAAPGLKTQLEQVVIVDGSTDERFEFHHWPGRVRKNLNQTMVEIAYFGEDTFDDVRKSSLLTFTQARYKELSKNASDDLQAALDLAYKAQYGKKPPAK